MMEIFFWDKNLEQNCFKGNYIQGAYYNNGTLTKFQCNTKNISHMFGECGKNAVSKILRANKFYPYHVTLVQGLKEEDLPRKIQFCKFL